jgi:hypothetical protein
MRAREFLTEYRDTPPLSWTKEVTDDPKTATYESQLTPDHNLYIGIHPELADREDITYSIYTIDWGLLSVGHGSVSYFPHSNRTAQERRKHIKLINKILSTVKAAVMDFFVTVEHPMFITFEPATAKLGSVYDKMVTDALTKDPYFSQFGYVKVDYRTMEQKFWEVNGIDTDNRSVLMLSGNASFWVRSSLLQ